MINRKDCIRMELSCPGRGEMLPVLRNFIRSVAEKMGFPSGEIVKIEMAVDEACANIVKHAYKSGEGLPDKDGKKEDINIEIKSTANCLNIIISDFGIGNRGGPHKGVEDIGEFIKTGHGLGTFIIHKFMDNVEISYPEDRGTRISMLKYLSPGK